MSNITAVMSSSVDSRKVSRRDAVAKHLLHWAVADRHAAGVGEMANDVGEADHAERAGSAALARALFLPKWNAA